MLARKRALAEAASERAEFPVLAGNDTSAKWPPEGVPADDRARISTDNPKRP